MNDFNQSQVLTAVVKRVEDKNTGLLGAFFTQTTKQKTKDVRTDINQSLPEIAPVMSDKERGKVLKNTSRVTKILQPAFSRLSDIVDLDKVLLRQPGQELAGEYDNTKAVKLAMVEEKKTSIRMRQKKMAADALALGKVETYDQDSKSTKEIDFNRATALSTTLTSGDTWADANKATVDPISQIESWADAIRDESGADANVLVLDPKAWAKLRVIEKVQSKLDTRRGSISEMETACNTIGNLKYVGSLGSVEVVVYSEKYKDSTGAMKSMLPANTAILLDSVNLMGVMHYGALKGENEVVADEFVVRENADGHTGETEIIVESRYLPVPHNINATFAATVA